MAAESSTASLKAVLKRLAKQYELAVVRDPSFATRIELGLKISSYLIPGRENGRVSIEITTCLLIIVFYTLLFVSKES